MGFYDDISVIKKAIGGIGGSSQPRSSDGRFGGKGGAKSPKKKVTREPSKAPDGESFKDKLDKHMKGNEGDKK